MGELPCLLGGIDCGDDCGDDCDSGLESGEPEQVTMIFDEIYLFVPFVDPTVENVELQCCEVIIES